MSVYYVHIHWSKKGTKSQATEVHMSGILENRNNGLGAVRGGCWELGVVLMQMDMRSCV